jgi:hypothetical protein
MQPLEWQITSFGRLTPAPGSCRPGSRPCCPVPSALGGGHLPHRGSVCPAITNLTAAGESLHAPVCAGLGEARTAAKPRQSDRDLCRRSRDPVLDQRNRSRRKIHCWPCHTRSGHPLTGKKRPKIKSLAARGGRAVRSHRHPLFHWRARGAPRRPRPARRCAVSRGPSVRLAPPDQAVASTHHSCWDLFTQDQSVASLK